MTLAAGTRLGAYDIVSLIGAGGMGEVYRARDTRLKREVAIKVLPDAFANDAERLARFQREAELLATLNHPNIAQIHGVEDRALVLELVEGQSLAERIAQGPMPIDEALRIAKQIAEALEAAHERGVIHRDLKPANIKLSVDGRVKVLDFGLAKLSDSTSMRPHPDLSMSPTVTSPVTMGGVILGTAAYMSPEQARGQSVDRRADLWAFGCVLYEMLTAKRPFAAETVTDLIARIIEREPSYEALPAATPAAVRRLLRRCLTKNPHDRLGDAAAARLEIQDANEAEKRAVVGGAKAPGLAWVLAGAIGGLLCAGAVAWLFLGSAESPSSPISRFTIAGVSAPPVRISDNEFDIAIAPDGLHVAYIGSASELMVRALEGLEPVTITTAGDVREPFFSPDGRSIGFFVGGGGRQVEMRKVAVTGGGAVMLADLGSAAPRGATWIADGRIVFGTTEGSGLLELSAAGGAPQVLTTPDVAAGEEDHFWPSAVGDGSAVLFTIIPRRAAEARKIAVFDKNTGRRKTIITNGSYAHYSPSGHIVYSVGGVLHAVAFDASRLEVTGEPLRVLENVDTKMTGAANFALSRSGALVYTSGATGDRGRTLVWVDRNGREEPIGVPARRYFLPRVAPDATRIAVDIRDEDQDIWLWDLHGKSLMRFTFDGAADHHPVWTPDGRRLAFASRRNGRPNVFWQAVDGTGTPEQLTHDPNGVVPQSFTPDASRLLLHEYGSETASDVHTLDLNGTHEVKRLLASQHAEQSGEISPDGKWVAYESDESGRGEIYVRPYPDIDRGLWQISSDGGTRPVWASSGRELFYISAGPRRPDAALVAVAIQTTPRLIVGQRRTLFPIAGRYFFGASGRTYDVAPDASRFVMVKLPEGGAADASISKLVLVERWFQELKQRVPIRD